MLDIYAPLGTGYAYSLGPEGRRNLVLDVLATDPDPRAAGLESLLRDDLTLADDAADGRVDVLSAFVSTLSPLLHKESIVDLEDELDVAGKEHVDIESKQPTKKAMDDILLQLSPIGITRLVECILAQSRTHELRTALVDAVNAAVQRQRAKQSGR